MGDALKSARVTEDGIYARTNWSFYTRNEVLRTKNFYKVFLMLWLSCTFCYFMKMNATQFAMQYHDQHNIITATFYPSAIFDVFWRYLLPWLMVPHGFYKVYLGVLVVQAFLCFTMTLVAPYPYILQAYAVLSHSDLGATMAIFTPFSAVLYGGV